MHLLEFFDDFIVNVSGRWAITTQAGTCSQIYSPNEGDGSLNFSCDASSRGILDYDDALPDLRNTTQFSFYAVNGVNEPRTAETFEILATDGTSEIIIWRTASIAANQNFNITGSKVGETNVWNTFTNGSLQRTTDISSLDFTKQIKTRFKVRGTTIASQIFLYDMLWGGAMLNMSDLNGTYHPTGNITQCVQLTENNVSQALLTAKIFEPDGTNIEFFLTNTCNSTNPTFESVALGQIHAFASVGNFVGWRGKLNTSVNTSSAIIYQVELSVSPGSLENISVDFGSDGDIDWEFLNVLNATTSPRVVNGTLEDFRQFRTDNCNQTTTTCQYPITISAVTGGSIEIRKVNTTIEINNLELNISKVINKSIINLTVTFTNSILEMDGLDLNYRGRKNFTINVSHNVNTTILLGRASQIAEFIFSKFDRILPYSFTDVILPFPIRSVNDTNVTPFLQTITKPGLNISGLALEPFDIALRRNETNSCLEIKAANNSNVSSAVTVNLTTTFKTVASNITGDISSSIHQGIWLWFDLNSCNASSRPFIRGVIKQQSCCSECTNCWEK